GEPMTTALRAPALALVLLMAALPGNGQDRSVAVPRLDAIEAPGLLTAQDAKDSKLKSPAQQFRVRLREGRTYVIEMRARDAGFDPYLRLEDSGGKELARDDDGGGDSDARIVFRCPQDGTYTVVATSFGGSLGRFLLTVNEMLQLKSSLIELPLRD